MNKEKRGFIELVAASFLFSLFGLFTRLISGYLGVFSQLILRALMMSVIFYLFIYFTKTRKKVGINDIGLLLFRGLLIVIDFSCFYYAVNNLQLGLTLFLLYSANIIISFVIGTIFLNEKMTRIKYISIFAALLGLFIMFKDAFFGVKIIPSLAALISGLCFGIATTTSKKLSDKYGSMQINLIGYITAFILLIPILVLSKEVLNYHLPLIVWIELVGFSFVGVIAFYFTLNGFKHLEAQKASLIMLLELLFVILIGLIIYSEIPSINTIAGGLCILFALVLPNINNTHTIISRN